MEMGGGRKKRERPKKGRHKPQGTVAEPQPMWGMLYADDAGIVSRSRHSLAKMLAGAVAMYASFGLAVSEAKTETVCPMTKGMDRVTFVTEAAGQVHKQSAKFVYLGATVCVRMLTFTVEINRRVLLTGQPTSQTAWPAAVRPVHRNPLTESTDAQKTRSWKPCSTGLSRGAPPSPTSPYYARLPTDCSCAASDGGENAATVTTCYPTQTRSPRLAVRTSRRQCENVGHFSRGSWPVYTGNERPPLE